MSAEKNALISVFDKRNLHILVPYLEENNYHIYTTGGTMTRILQYAENKKIVHSISDYTKYPEICDGRVKTLHPRIYGGILGIRNNESHMNDLTSIDAKLFSLVVVNLYPFEKKLLEKKLLEKVSPKKLLEKKLLEKVSPKKLLEKVSQNTDTITDDVLLENIDIGGPTLIRAACKNYNYISVLTDPSQYDDFVNNKTDNKILAKEAMQRIMKYDIAISNWFSQDDEDILGVTYTKQQTLKYGLNPYQKPSYIYTKNDEPVPFKVLNGNPGYINLLDVHYAIHLVLEAKNQLCVDCCASYKHNSPAGVAMPHTQYMSDIMKPVDIFLAARNIDPKSSFGDIIGFSGTVDLPMAKILKNYVSDGIIAADYTPDALAVLKTKKKGAYLIMRQNELPNGMEFRDINGIILAQPNNNSVLALEKVMAVPINIQKDMILGYITLKYTQSNCVCFVYRGKAVGIGAGQQNRVDCIKIAGEKMKDWFKRNELDINSEKEIVMISDAFLPFRDNVEVAAEYNVKYILQPGNSIRDDEIIEACNEYGIKMVLTDQRVFTH